MWLWLPNCIYVKKKMQEYLLRWQTFINTQKTHIKKEPQIHLALWGTTLGRMIVRVNKVMESK